jgi:hypothetical protein
VNGQVPTPPEALFRSVGDDLLAPHASVYGRDPATRAIGLAQALATSPVWARLRARAVLVVRPGTPSLLGVLGVIPDAERPLVEAMGWHVDQLLQRLRPIPYAEVEAACERLADRLRERLGDELLQRATLVGIPRGGQVVAGLLAYALGIPSERVGRIAGSGPVLLVDDCVLSGTRLEQWLAHHPGVSVVAAHLASAPGCREAVARHDRVMEVVGAIDLRDHAAQRADGWHERWRERSPDDLWTGDPDHVAFPWNEPDSAVWNPVRERTERSWRVVPPAWCLKNRVEGATAPAEVQVNAVTAAGPHRPADDVLWARLGEEIAVASARDDRAVRLRGIAALAWDALLEHGSAEPIAEDVAEAFRVSSTDVRADLTRLVAQLTDRGLVRPS